MAKFRPDFGYLDFLDLATLLRSRSDTIGYSVASVGILPGKYYWEKSGKILKVLPSIRAFHSALHHHFIGLDVDVGNLRRRRSFASIDKQSKRS